MLDPKRSRFLSSLFALLITAATAQAQIANPGEGPDAISEQPANPNLFPYDPVALIAFTIFIAAIIGFYLYVRNLPTEDSKKRKPRKK